jgi:Fungal hydrophobin
MRATIILTALVGATVTVASTIPLEERAERDLCTGTDSNAVCCATDVLGVADLDCAPRKFFVKNLFKFEILNSSIIYMPLQSTSMCRIG